MELGKEHYRAYTFIELQRGRTPAEVYEQLQEAHIPGIPSRATVFRWCHDFTDGTRTSLHDQPKSGRPSTSMTEDNIRTIQQSIAADPRQSLRVLAEALGCGKDSVRKILTEQLGLKKLCSVWVPHVLSEANKKDRVECVRLMDRNSMEDCLRYWATEDETWVLFHGLPTKEENRAWLPPNASRPRVVLPKLTNQKTMLLLSFTGDGKCNVHAIRPGETVTAERYIQFVHDAGEKWRTLRSAPTRLTQLW